MTLFEKFFKDKEFVWKPGLNRINSAVKELSLKLPPSLIVAGTNGKGSSALLVASILKSHGLRCGLFSSPHLYRFNERFMIGLKSVSDEALNDAFLNVKFLIDKYSLTYFESAFLVSLFLFRNCDFNVFEVGLGGRLDATNVLNHTAALITHIDIDHTNYLGKNIMDIAFEKLSVIKNCPAVVSKNEPIISDMAKDFTDNLFIYGRDFSAGNIDVSLGGTSFTYNKKTFKTNLIGKAQAYNAVSSIFASWLLLRNVFGIKPSYELTKKALLVQLNGRIQVIRRKPLLIIDVAHNVDALKNLFNTLKSLNVKANVLFSCLRDKDVAGNLKVIRNYLKFSGKKLLVTNIKNSRGMRTEELLKEARIMGIDSKAFKEFNGEPLIVAGSFYLLKALRNEL